MPFDGDQRNRHWEPESPTRDTIDDVLIALVAILHVLFLEEFVRLLL
jgi:hypothetical protein